jgi:hypothetical protein
MGRERNSRRSSRRMAQSRFKRTPSPNDNDNEHALGNQSQSNWNSPVSPMRSDLGCLVFPKVPNLLAKMAHRIRV